MELSELKDLCSCTNEVDYLMSGWKDGVNRGRDFTIIIHAYNNKWIRQDFDRYGNPVGKPKSHKNISVVYSIDVI